MGLRPQNYDYISILGQGYSTIFQLSQLDVYGTHIMKQIMKFKECFQTHASSEDFKIKNVEKQKTY